jgi:UDP-glucuronate 4-epimerase
LKQRILRILDNIALPNPDWSGAEPDSGTSKAPWRVYNIGNQSPVELLDYIETLEKCLGKTAEKELLPLQPGDVPDTYADVEALVEDVGYKPDTTIELGIAKFVTFFEPRNFSK